MEEDKSVLGRRKVVRIILFIFLIITVIWFSWTLYEFARVQKGNKPIVCLNEVKDIENQNEYSKTCKGILYKYREYFAKESDSLVAREFTLFFTDFQRNNH